MNKDLLFTYAEKHTSPEPALLQELSRETALRTIYPRMLSGHLQGRFLSMVSRLKRPNFILEIGTFTGYSALCLAEGLATDGELHTIELNPELEEPIQDWLARSPHGSKIKLHIGDARKLIPVLADTIPFDLVFIDAEKSQYPFYYEILRKRLKPGTIILADNVLWDGKIILEPAPGDYDTEGILAFNTMVRQDTGVEVVILPFRDGTSIIRIL